MAIPAPVPRITRFEKMGYGMVRPLGPLRSRRTALARRPQRLQPSNTSRCTIATPVSSADIRIEAPSMRQQQTRATHCPPPGAFIFSPQRHHRCAHRGR